MRIQCGTILAAAMSLIAAPVEARDVLALEGKGGAFVILQK